MSVSNFLFTPLVFSLHFLYGERGSFPLSCLYFFPYRVLRPQSKGRYLSRYVESIKLLKLVSSLVIMEKRFDRTFTHVSYLSSHCNTEQKTEIDNEDRPTNFLIKKSNKIL